MIIYDPAKVGDKLLEYRNNLGLTQIEAAEKAFLSERTYADLERGNAKMRLETLIHLCNAFNATPNDFLIETDESDLEKAKAIAAQLKEFDESDYKKFSSLFNILLMRMT